MAAPQHLQPCALAAMRQQERRGCCFLVRHTPHPRRVCHIKGLNNIPICAVNDEDLSGAVYDLGQNQDQTEPRTSAKSSRPSPAPPTDPPRGVSPAPRQPSPLVPSNTPRSISPATHQPSPLVPSNTPRGVSPAPCQPSPLVPSNTPRGVSPAPRQPSPVTPAGPPRAIVPASRQPSPATSTRPSRGISPAPHQPSPMALNSPPRTTTLTESMTVALQPHSGPSGKAKRCFRTSSENPLVIRKEEVQAWAPPSPTKSSSSDRLSSRVDSRDSVDGRDSTVQIPNYLDQEIKILAKLCDTLNTDSLADVLQWLHHANPKEKEWLSALIHAELTQINLLMCRHCRRGSMGPMDPGPGSRRPTPGKPLTPPTAMASRAHQGRTPSRGAGEERPTGLSSVDALGSGSPEHWVPTALHAAARTSPVPAPSLSEAEAQAPLFIRRSKTRVPLAERFSPTSPGTPGSISWMAASAGATPEGHSLGTPKALSAGAHR
ncbi:uncharacterized protein C4orf17 homolog [Erinaceus europaeus]|uniref:Uncharacterized protein C4orf17 homolog n=1 Tax=Erinaceus europaeus TaxID=9365 RepID=A0ABM3VVM6_ERIEU|nr:uncharacterized protein C4orf17 homolog [Erinaceus europaeus]